jgi:osmotically-inducible protein OsmY
VEHDPITVSVKDQRVTLSGTVGSAAEKTRASDDAWVDGVSAVDATAIQVKPQERPDPNLSVGTKKTDQQIATAIKDAAFYDPRVKSFNINPSVSEGVVTLSGTVDTVQAKQAAETIARNTVGVMDVKNQLAVRWQQPVSDRVLATELETALAFDPLTNANDVHVAVKDGQVTLSGSVATFSERAEAFDDAARMPGVMTITDQLTVRDPLIPYVYTTWLDPFVPYAESWYIVGPSPSVPDAVIQERIKNEFSWNPFVLPQDVQVKVQSGKAILTGTVHSYRERNAAGVSAIRGGAVAVDNELKVG